MKIQTIDLMKWTLLTLIIVAAFSSTGCYYDAEDELYPRGNCDTSNVNYSTTITGILNNYGCVSCHGGTSPNGGINLQGYTNVKLRVDDGRLLGSITHSSGFSPMPQGATKMRDCDINKVKAWIHTGAQQN